MQRPADVTRRCERRSSLTNPSSALVGRGSELAVARGALTGGARLVTFVGTPGVGKTRLAQELTEEFACGARSAKPSGDRRPDSLRPVPGEFLVGDLDAVLECDLVHARSVPEVAAALAELLGLPPRTAREAHATDEVGRALAEKGRALLFLDNFEQIADGRLAVLAWLAAAPDLQLLVTSRRRVGIDAEVVLELAPLPVGSRSESGRLFAARAAAVRPALELDPGFPALADAIAERLEGLPLAIELAASRVALASPSQILARLDQCLAVLGGRRRGPSSKQDSMRAGIGCSWSLLDEPTRIALARCSVFLGGFSLEAAEAILSDLPGSSDGPLRETDPGLASPRAARQALALLGELVEGSLLRVHAAPGLPHESRFSMYAVIQEFAGEQLELLGQREATIAARDAYFLAVGAAWGAALREHGGRERAQRLVLDHANLLAVVHRALEAEPTAASAERALRALLALEPTEVRRSSSRLASLLEAALGLQARAGLAPGPLVLRARLALARALSVTRLVPRALGLAEEVREAAAAGGEGALEVEALLVLGWCAFSSGRADAAIAGLRLGIERCAALGHRPLEVRLRACLAAVLLDCSRFDDALEELDRARPLALELGDEPTTALLLRTLGQLHAARGRLTEARRALTEGLEVARALGDKVLESGCLSGLAGVLAEEERLEEGAAEYARACALHREVGDRRGEGETLANRGDLLHGLGRSREAEECLESAARILRSVGAHGQEARVLARLGALAADTDRLEHAQRCFDRSRALAVLERHPDRRHLLELTEAHVSLARGRTRVRPSRARWERERFAVICRFGLVSPHDGWARRSAAASATRRPARTAASATRTAPRRRSSRSSRTHPSAAARSSSARPRPRAGVARDVTTALTTSGAGHGYWGAGINIDDDLSCYDARVRFGLGVNNETSIRYMNDAIGFGASGYDTVACEPAGTESSWRVGAGFAGRSLAATSRRRARSGCGDSWPRGQRSGAVVHDVELVEVRRAALTVVDRPGQRIEPEVPVQVASV